MSEKLETETASEMRSQGFTEAQIKKRFSDENAFERYVAERQQAYCGWLVSNPVFHANVQLLREGWLARIQCEGMPRLPWHPMGKAPQVPEEERPYYMDYIITYRNWSLDHLTTFELPVPMRADLTLPSLYPVDSLRDAALVISIPWYLLRDKKLKLRDLADFHRLGDSRANLNEWLEGAKNWGTKRFATMLKVFMCYCLGLHARYRERIKGNYEWLDHVFARYLLSETGKRSEIVTEAENVRKVRQNLFRRLRSE